MTPAPARREKVNAMTAEQRGMEMMQVTMGQLPPLALEFAKHLCARVGMCMEVLLTAWTVYAQEVEGLEATDELYISSQEHRTWFAKKLAMANPEAAAEVIREADSQLDAVRKAATP